jgi:REP element-mobilizing transposase RayT
MANADASSARPLAYFITFTCHGTWLRGDAKGSVDVRHNVYGTPTLEANDRRRVANAAQLTQPPYELDSDRRAMVKEAIIEVCRYRQWQLLALHVRTNHVHAVVAADSTPEKVMNDFKAYSSRRLNAAGVDATDCARWTRHGSTRYLWAPAEVDDKVQYTLFEQGQPMAVFPEATPQYRGAVAAP